MLHHRATRRRIGIAGIEQPGPIAIEDRQRLLEHAARHALDLVRSLHGTVDPVHAFEEPQVLSAFLLCTLLLSDIDRAADVLDHLPRAVANRMPHGTERSHSGIAVPASVLDFQVGTFAHGLREAFHRSGAVIRKNVLRDLLERRQALRRVQAVNAITLVRPIQNGI